MNSADMVTTYAVHICEPIPDKPGYSRLKENARVIDLVHAVNEHLDHAGIIPDEYSFSTSLWRRDEDRRIPTRYRWLIAFAVEGGSEGYYVHIGALLRDDSETPTDVPNTRFEDYGCAKCNTQENAFAVAREVQRFLCAAEWNS